MMWGALVHLIPDPYRSVETVIAVAMLCIVFGETPFRLATAEIHHLVFPVLVLVWAQWILKLRRPSIHIPSDLITSIAAIFPFVDHQFFFALFIFGLG